MDKIKRTIDFPADLYEQLRKLAASEDRSVNSQVVQLLKAAIAEIETESEFQRSHRAKH